MNVVTRAGGGLLSDVLARAFGGGTHGMRGRILAHTCCLVFEGVTLIIFSKMQSLGASIVLLVLFSLGVQMGNGSTFAIVPFVCPQATGAVSGIAGAGGNLGAIAWSLLFRFGPEDDAECFMYLGIAVLCISLSTLLIRIQGHDALLFKAKGEPAAVDTY
jgi:MFS transporter, NNP family, nitrate/nitrite transporter